METSRLSTNVARWRRHTQLSKRTVSMNGPSVSGACHAKHPERVDSIDEIYARECRKELHCLEVGVNPVLQGRVEKRSVKVKPRGQNRNEGLSLFGFHPNEFGQVFVVLLLFRCTMFDEVWIASGFSSRSRAVRVNPLFPRN